MEQNKHVLFPNILDKTLFQIWTNKILQTKPNEIKWDILIKQNKQCEMKENKYVFCSKKIEQEEAVSCKFLWRVFVNPLTRGIGIVCPSKVWRPKT